MTVRVRSAAFDPDTVVAAVGAALRSAFSLQRRGLGQPLYRAELFQQVEAVTGVESSDCLIVGLDETSATVPVRRRQVAGVVKVLKPDERQVIHVAADGTGITVRWQEFSGTVQEPGDLARYLDACGELLDALKGTLEQRLADAFPDNPPPGERACQDWLLPYFADLLDVRLVSPEVQGRRNEIANAVAWRQRKGTLSVVEGRGSGRLAPRRAHGAHRHAAAARDRLRRGP